MSTIFTKHGHLRYASKITLGEAQVHIRLKAPPPTNIFIYVRRGEQAHALLVV